MRTLRLVVEFETCDRDLKITDLSRMVLEHLFLGKAHKQLVLPSGMFRVREWNRSVRTLRKQIETKNLHEGRLSVVPLITQTIR